MNITPNGSTHRTPRQAGGRFAAAIADVIADDTQLSTVEATLLGRGLAGMAQIGARYWLETDGSLDIDAASELIYRLAWRGISRFPKEI